MRSSPKGCRKMTAIIGAASIFVMSVAWAGPAQADTPDAPPTTSPAPAPPALPRSHPAAPPAPVQAPSATANPAPKPPALPVVPAPVAPAVKTPDPPKPAAPAAPDPASQAPRAGPTAQAPAQAPKPASQPAKADPAPAPPINAPAVTPPRAPDPAPNLGANNGANAPSPVAPQVPNLPSIPGNNVPAPAPIGPNQLPPGGGNDHRGSLPSQNSQPGSGGSPLTGPGGKNWWRQPGTGSQLPGPGGNPLPGPGVNPLPGAGGPLPGPGGCHDGNGCGNVSGGHPGTPQPGCGIPGGCQQNPIPLPQPVGGWNPGQHPNLPDWVNNPPKPLPQPFPIGNYNNQPWQHCSGGQQGCVPQSILPGQWNNLWLDSCGHGGCGGCGGQFGFGGGCSPPPNPNAYFGGGVGGYPTFYNGYSGDNPYLYLSNPGTGQSFYYPNAGYGTPWQLPQGWCGNSCGDGSWLWSLVSGATYLASGILSVAVGGLFTPFIPPIAPLIIAAAGYPWFYANNWIQPDGCGCVYVDNTYLYGQQQGPVYTVTSWTPDIVTQPARKGLPPFITGDNPTPKVVAVVAKAWYARQPDIVWFGCAVFVVGLLGLVYVNRRTLLGVVRVVR